MKINNLSGESSKVTEIILGDEVICSYKVIRLILANNIEIKGSLKSLNHHYYEQGFFDIELVHAPSLTAEDLPLAHIDQRFKVIQLWLTSEGIEKLKAEAFVP